MKRLLLIAREKKTGVLIALAALTIAVLAAAGSGAWFTARSEISNTAVTAGKMAVSGPDTFDLSAAKMAPGDTATGTIDITNDGDFAGKLAIAIEDYSGSETAGQTSTGADGDVLSKDLDLTILNQTGDVLYHGALTDLTADDFSQVVDATTTVAPGDSATYTFEVHFRNNTLDANDIDGGDNVYQSATSTFPFKWEIRSQETPMPY